ncbi:MAG: YidC/Oxa1 family membrane protein insertase [Ardenticatenaceae bacterium]
MPGWEQFVGLIESLLSLLHNGLGSWGLAIVLFTVAIKALTWPLTSKQLKSSKGMQELQPKVKALQEKYKDDKEKQTQEMMKLYQEMGVNPLMGCLPMLIQFPIWIGLYRAILNLADQGALDGAFLWIPSLACPSENIVLCGPATGMAWPIDFANLTTTWPYLILPLLTVVTQIGVSRLMSPTASNQPAKGEEKGKEEDPTQAMMKQMTTIMPLMFGFFAIQFPAGLALYWVTNNMLTFVQYWFINQEKKSSAMTLAPLAATDGGTVIDLEAKPKTITPPKPKKTTPPKLKKEQTDARKSRRKRKKRRS